ncbi:MAG TPA: H-type lectin domain-containing protein, partial [Chloroflexota bacterium]|nr:H-type lectin domain-containing protein [Chloroflexota bacterium]
LRSNGSVLVQNTGGSPQTLSVGAVNTNGSAITSGAITASGVVTGNGISSSSQVYATTVGSLYLRGADGNVHIDQGGATLYAATGNFTGNVTVQNSGSNVVPFTVNGVYEHIEHGSVTLSGITNNTGQSQAQTFTRAFNSAPIIIVGINTPTAGDVQQWHPAAQGATTTGFNLRIYNTSGSTGNCSAYWFAMGN